jgi:hypothetical protein
MVETSKERMETVGVRFPSSDIEWLASLRIKGAVTPSDKIRSLVAEARRRHEGHADVEACLAWLRDLLAPEITALRTEELERGTHSELITLVAEALPQMFALLLARPAPGPDARERQEDMLARLCFRLFESILRLGVTTRSACYNPDVISGLLPPVIELSRIISTTRNPEEK